MIYFVGMGPGMKEYMSLEAIAVIEKADFVFAYPKHLEMMNISEEKGMNIFGKIKGLSDQIQLKQREGFENIAVLVSGDPSVFSLTKSLAKAFSPDEYVIIPGLGSYQLLSARLGLQTPLPERITLHGKPLHNLSAALMAQKPLMLYTDGKSTPCAIAQYLVKKHLSDWTIVVGENMGAENEKLSTFTASDLASQEGLNWDINVCYIAPPLRPPSEKQGILYGMGIGPGDPELITLKALRLIKSCDVILCPKSPRKDHSLAREILEEVAGYDLPYQNIDYPQVLDKEELGNQWMSHGKDIFAMIQEGKRVAFITLGDPGIYSTFIYLLAALQEIDKDVPFEVIPGISSVQLAAARLGQPLMIGKEKCLIMPTPDDMEDLTPLLEQHESIVLMKVGKRLESLKVYLKAKGLLASASLISRAGFEGETKYKNLEDLPEGANANLSVIQIRKGKIL